MKKYINKKIIVALLLLLPGQHNAGATTVQKGARIFGGTAAVGGALLAGKTAYDFYNAFNRAKEKVIATDPTFEINDFDSFKRVAAVARKDKHFGEKRFWAGCGLLVFGSGVGMFTQHQITTDAAHVKRVAAETLKKHEARFETIKGSLAALNAAYKKVSFKDNLPKLQVIQDQLAKKDIADKTTLKPADIKFLEAYNKDLYDALIQDITHHNNQVTNRIKCAAIDKWNAFLATNKDKPIFQAIGLDEDFFKEAGSDLAYDKIAAYDAWKAKNEPILNFLKANGFDKLVAAEAAAKPLQFIKVENGDQFKDGSKAIYDAFVEVIRKNNLDFLDQKIETEIAAAKQKAAVDPCESNPFKSWAEIRNTCLTAEQKETEATDFDATQLNNLQDSYARFLAEKASEKLATLDNVVVAALGITKDFIDTNPCLILNWAYLPEQQTTARIKAGTAQARRQLYDILLEVKKDLYHNGLDQDNYKLILEQIKRWYDVSARSWIGGGQAELDSTLFFEAFKIFEVINYDHGNDGNEASIKLIQAKLSCLPNSDLQAALQSAFTILKREAIDEQDNSKTSYFQNLVMQKNGFAPVTDPDDPRKTIEQQITYKATPAEGLMASAFRAFAGKTYEYHAWHLNKHKM